MGLLIHLYRDSSLGDCSAGGITSTAVGLCVVNVPGPFGPTAAHPAVILTTGQTGSPRLVPAEPSPVFGATCGRMVAHEPGCGRCDDGWCRRMRDHDGECRCKHTAFQPVDRPDHVGPMMGGCLADSSDARWTTAVRHLVAGGGAATGLAVRLSGFVVPCPTAVPVHDRFETTEYYREMSRD